MYYIGLLADNPEKSARKIFFCNPFTKKIAKKDKGFLLLYMALADQKYINEGNRLPEMETVLEIYKNVIKKV